MGTPVPVNFGPDTGPARSKNVSAGGLVNAIAEAAPDAKTQFAVYGLPGLSVFSNTGNSSGCRGFLRVSESTLYAVFGETMYRFSPGGASTSVGTVAGTDYVRMAYNKADPVEVAIVSQGKRYLMVSDVITEIADVDVSNLPQGAIDVAYLDGFFIFGYPDGLMYSSAINDGTSYSALDFTEAEAKPDRTRALGILGDRLVNFGASSVEFFYNDAAAEGFPFAPQGGALIDRGILDRNCWSDFDNTLAWIDDRGLVVRGEGSIAKTFGTYPVHKDIQDLIAKQETAKIAVSTWSFAGHDVFQIWSPEWCWCFDASSQKWFRRKSQDRDTWAGRFVFREFNKTLVADAQTGILYEQREDTHDENGKARIIELTSNYIYSGASRVRHNWLVLDIETGVGNAEDADSEDVTPECVVSWSDDGGKSFDGHRQVSIGQQGQYRARVKINRLSTSGVHGRVYRVTFSAARPFTLIGALADVDVLRV